MEFHRQAWGFHLLLENVGKRKALFFGALALAVTGATFFIVWAASNREPSYQGKPFSYWLDRVPGTYVAPGVGGFSVQPPMFYAASFQTAAEYALGQLRHQEFEHLEKLQNKPK
jgi:hypothetical protein